MHGFLFLFFFSLALPDDAPAAAFAATDARLARASAADTTMILEAMALLLQDVLRQPTTRAALDHLAPEPVPYFVHVSSHMDHEQKSLHPHADAHVRSKCMEHDLIIPSIPAYALPAAAQAVPSAISGEYVITCFVCKATVSLKQTVVILFLWFQVSRMERIRLGWHPVFTVARGCLG